MKICLCCFSESFTALALLFRSCIHFELNFVCRMDKGPPLWHVAVLGSQHYLSTISFPLWMISTSVENHLTIDTWVYFWTLSSLPLSYLFGFVPAPHCLHYCCLVVSFDIGKSSPPNLCLFFKMIWSIWGPSQLHMNFRINFCQVLQKVLEFW